MPFYGGVKDLLVEVLQQEQILSFRSYDPERSTPDVIEFSMFADILLPSVPFQSEVVGKKLTIFSIFIK